MNQLYHPLLGLVADAVDKHGPRLIEPHFGVITPLPGRQSEPYRMTTAVT